MPMKWHGDEAKARILKHLNANLDRAASHLQRALRDSFGSSGKPNASKKFREENRSLPWQPPHVQTGFLKSNINVDTPVEGVRRIGTGVGSAAVVGYAIWLEFGTRKMLPRPWLRPTVWREREAVRTEVTRPMG